jgi:hypothetical protein
MQPRLSSATLWSSMEARRFEANFVLMKMIHRRTFLKATGAAALAFTAILRAQSVRPNEGRSWNGESNPESHSRFLINARLEADFR